MTKKEIEKVVDGLLPMLPTGKMFWIDSELSKYFKSIGSDINMNNDKTKISENVLAFMIECEYLKPNNELKDILERKGIDAKNAGGHFKYLEFLKKGKERVAKQDEILDLDLTLKNFEVKIGKKIKIAGFIIVLFSFFITVLTLKIWEIKNNNTKIITQTDVQQLHKEQDKLLDTLK